MTLCQIVLCSHRLVSVNPAFCFIGFASIGHQPPSILNLASGMSGKDWAIQNLPMYSL